MSAPASPSRSSAATRTEFDRQVQLLVDLAYPALTSTSVPQFKAALEPLLEAVNEARQRSTAVSPEDHVPFVIVVAAAPPAAAAERMTLGTKPAVLMLSAEEIHRFTPIAVTSVPTGFGYVLSDVDTGSEFCGVRPADALPVITRRARTPLTIAEGVALVTQRPDMLRKNKCFSLLASRCGDKRVPAIWISAGAPKLGWCWDGNPHTWLGSASAAARAG